MLLVILSRAKCQWKVCYNKIKQGNFQKTDAGSQDIFQELSVKRGHTKSFFLRYLGNS